MIYLTPNSREIRAKKRMDKKLDEKNKGDFTAAIYNRIDDRIVYFKVVSSNNYVLIHEFMHKIFCSMKMWKASKMWDSEFIFEKVEMWVHLR